MDRRQCSLMREFIALTQSMVEIGAMSIREAADSMKPQGVPLAIALRTLARRKL